MKKEKQLRILNSQHTNIHLKKNKAMKSNYPTGKWELIENPIALESKLAIVSKEEGEKPILVCQLTTIRGDSYKDNIPYIESFYKLIVEAGTIVNETGKTPLQLADENKNLLEALIELEEKTRSLLVHLVDSPMDITNDVTMMKVRNAINKSTKQNENKY